MSSVRGGGSRGGGRGSSLQSGPTARGRGGAFGSSNRGSYSKAAARTGTSFRGASRSRGPPKPTQGRHATQQQRPPAAQASSGRAQSKGSWQERYQTLTKARERERAEAIRQGLIADPEKPRLLSEAVTPVGTCLDMCAEYERVERVVQKDVWPEETDPSQSVFGSTDNEPDEARMVKKFRRAAAGLEEQLPSDLRPPHILKATCDYLFETVIGNASSLGQVHHFVWDRTRAIRNDFSIQQLRKPEELSIAIECYERIARFHMMSLHILAVPEKPYSKYDWQQEREQLDRTLLSLMQYYDDSRGRIELKNEAEFRAYCVIFQLQDPTPDLEDRIQTWPVAVIRDGRVQRALDVYMAACNVLDAQGPLKPRATHLIARQDWQRFWELIASRKVSYLMACVAEIYFNLVRRTVLNALFRAFRPNSSVATPEWTVDVLCELLAFDEGDEVYTYCELFGFSFKENDDGDHYLDLSSVRGKTLPEPSGELRKQAKTDLVENKRFGRTLPAVINGLSVSAAQAAGMIEDEVDDGGEEEMAEDSSVNDHTLDHDNSSAMTGREQEDPDSLFVPRTTSPNPFAKQSTPSSFAGFGTAQKAQTPTFGSQSGSFSFGKPTSTGHNEFTSTSNTTFGASAGSKSTFVAPTQTTNPSFNFLQPSAPSTAQEQPAKQATTPGFSFLQDKSAQKTSEETAVKSPSPTSSPFDTNRNPFSSFGQASKTPPPAASPFALPKPASPSFGQQETSQQPLPSFGASSGPFDMGKTSAPRSAFASSTLNPPQQNSQPEATAAPSADATSIFSNPQTQAPSTVKPFFAFQTSTPSPQSVQSSDTQKASQSQHSESALSPTPGPKPTQSSPNQPAPLDPNGPRPTFTSPPSPNNNNPPSPTGANQASSSNANTSLKRPSFSSDTKPKKPSPLANSITAEEEVAANHQTSLPPPAQVSAQPLPTFHQPAAPAIIQSEFKEKAKSPSPQPPKEDFDATLTRIARELTNDPIAGYMRQFVEHTVGKTITAVQAQLTKERDDRLALEFRHWTISRKFGKRWIEGFWRRKLAKTGRERRERRRRVLESGIEEGNSVNSGSRRSSVSGVTSRRVHRPMRSERAEVDEMFRQTVGREEELVRFSHQAESTAMKRPASSHSTDGGPRPSRAVGHKRLKSTSHVDDRGRVSKLNASKAQTANTDMLSRSSFLGFSLSPESRSTASTTRSNYFRLKALGVPSVIDSSADRGTKRRYSQSKAATPRTASPDGKRQLPRQSEEHDKMALQPASTTVAKAVVDEEDDALFARLKAAREMLNEGSAFFESEIAKEEEFRKSANSESSHESPSLARARAEARLLASQASSVNGTSITGRDVPAYRLRESRFVPREHYGKALERAKEMRESQSREASRPQSRAEIDFDASFSQPAPSRQSQSQQAHSAFSRPQNSHVNGFSFPSSTQSHTLGFSHASNALQAGQTMDFSNHTTPMSPSNPFLNHASNSNTTSQTTFGSAHARHQQQHEPPPPPFDQTIEPSQIPAALSSSFGATGDISSVSSWPLDVSTDNSQGTHHATMANGDFGFHEQSQAQVQVPDSFAGFTSQNYQHEVVEDGNEEVHDIDHGFADANPYAALADGDDMVEDEESQDAPREGFEGEYADEDDMEEFNGFARDGDEDQDDELLADDEDEDLEDDEELSEDEDEDDEEEDDDEEDENTWQGHGLPRGGYASMQKFSQPEPNEDAFNGAGGTVEEAIELSD